VPARPDGALARARRAVGRRVRAAAEARGRALVDLRRQRVVERSYAGPIPEWEALPASTFTTPHPMPGVAWDPLPGLELLRGPLRPLAAEYAPPPLPGVPDAERVELLRYYEGLDAASLHALLRFVRPRRVIELGSGVSTLIARAALDRNAREGAPGELRAFDPYPRAPTAGVPELRAIAAEDVPVEEVAALGPGDVLLVDTTHVVRTGGDVVRIYLDLLPRLAEGVLVHVHDVLLPYDYHRAWLENGWFWTEQYLLQAVLQGNDGWEVVLADHHLHRDHGPAVAEAVAAYDPARHHPSALWLRRRADGDPASLADRLTAHR